MVNLLQNAISAKKAFVFVPYSKINCQFLALLQNEGFIAKWCVTSVCNDSKFVTSTLLVEFYFSDNFSGSYGFAAISLVSRRSRQVFLNSNSMGLFNALDGFWVINTNRGVMSFLDAYKLNLGGEVLCVLFLYNMV